MKYWSPLSPTFHWLQLSGLQSVFVYGAGNTWDYGGGGQKASCDIKGNQKRVTRGGITGKHGGRRHRLTKTWGRTKTMYTDTLTRGSGTGRVRREKGRWGNEQKNTGGRGGKKNTQEELYNARRDTWGRDLKTKKETQEQQDVESSSK